MAVSKENYEKAFNEYQNLIVKSIKQPIDDSNKSDVQKKLLSQWSHEFSNWKRIELSVRDTISRFLPEPAGYIVAKFSASKVIITNEGTKKKTAYDVMPDYSKSDDESDDDKSDKSNKSDNSSQSSGLPSDLDFDKMDAIYGYVYTKYLDGKLVNDFMTFGPSFNSKDGEYHRHFCSFEKQMKTIKRHQKAFDVVEEHILQLKDSEVMHFTMSLHYDSDIIKISPEEIAEFHSKSRTAVKIYAMCWIYYYYDLRFGYAQNHLDPSITAMIYDSRDTAAEEAFDRLMEVIDVPEIQNIQFELGSMYFWEDIRNDVFRAKKHPLELGQKFIPLSVGEIENIENPIFEPWRELYFDMLHGTLILNRVTPCIPFTSPRWFLISNTDSSFFNNISMWNKYRSVPIVDEIIDKLEGAVDLSKASSERVDLIAERFYRLTDRISNSIDYAEEQIDMTNVTLCKAGEFIGRTLRDIPRWHRTDNNDLEYMIPIIFEFIYTLYSMNVLTGTMHGDFHLNNATLFQPGNEPRISKATGKTFNAFYVSDKTYIFPNKNVFAGIIDFSRTITNDYDKILKDFGERIAREFFLQQEQRAYEILLIYDPNFTKTNEKRLRILFKTKFNLMFKIISAIDIIKISKNLKLMLEIDPIEKMTQGVKTKSITLLGNINKLADKLFRENLIGAINKKFEFESQIEWVSKKVIEECFEEYEWKNQKREFTFINRFQTEKINEPDFKFLENIFSSNVKLIYNFEELENYNPMVSPEVQMDLNRKYGIDIGFVKNLNEYFTHRERHMREISTVRMKYVRKKPDIPELVTHWN